jgi:hypothetical protein
MLYELTKQNFGGTSKTDGLVNAAELESTVGAVTFGPKHTRRVPLFAFVSFVTAGSITLWALTFVNPRTGVEHPFRSGTTKNFMYGGPAGIMRLPVAVDGRPFYVKLVATGMDADGEFVCDIDVNHTSSPSLRGDGG